MFFSTRNLIRSFIVGVALLASGSVFAEGPCELQVLRVQVPDRAAAAKLDHRLDLWQVDGDKGVAIVAADSDAREWITAQGWAFDVDVERTKTVCTPLTYLPEQRSGIPGYPCYRTVEETYASAEQLAVAFPTLAEWIDIGDSWEKSNTIGGYDLMVLKLTNQETTGTPTGTEPPHGKPRLFVTSSIHARELTTAELMTRFGEYLLSNHGIDPDATWLLDEHEIHLMLHANPDGRKQAEGGVSWRKNTNQNYCGPTDSSRGADLNRNFEYYWGCCNGSSGDECSGTYRGPAAASEPEVQAVEAYAQSIFPDQRDDDPGLGAPADATGIYLDVHSSGSIIIWPWGAAIGTPPTNDTANQSAYQTLGRKLAHFNHYEPDHNIWYDVDGDTATFMYGDLGVAGFVFELGTQFFEECGEFESTIWPDNLPSLLYAAKAVRTPYQTPAGPDVYGINLTSGSFVEPGNPVDVSAIADDARYRSAGGDPAEPAQAIASAVAFLDLPPWASPEPTNVVALGAADGAFDSPDEVVTGSIDTTNLGAGRHIVYLQATDADGNEGAVSALFFWIVDPATAGHLTGTITRNDNGHPIEATIDLGITSSISDAGDGTYSLMLPADTYDVSISAPGFERRFIPDVAIAEGETIVIDAALIPYSSVASTDAESGEGQWEATAPWAITTEDAHSGTHVWSDSPDGDYPTGASHTLTSPTLNLTGVTGTRLEFWHRFAFEDGWDYGIVEYSTDGGSSWAELARYDGTPLSPWQEVVLDLSVLDGEPDARVRFLVDSDSVYEFDGWYLDDIMIAGINATGLFADGFEGGDTSAWSEAVE